MLTRLPSPRLRPFVGLLWASEGPVVGSSREIVLPTGRAHLAIRTRDARLRIHGKGSDPSEIAGAMLSGARSRPYVKDVVPDCGSVGAWLRPGAMPYLIGTPAESVAERHVPLERATGPGSMELVHRIRRASDPEQRLDLLESFLLERFAHSRGPHPGIARALEVLESGGAVGGSVRESGYGERQLRALFRSHVGLSPKRFSRVVRFQRAAGLLAEGRALLATALEAGYSDQAHLTREFRELAGISPGDYRRLRPAHRNHVPVADRRFVQDHPTDRSG